MKYIISLEHMEFIQLLHVLREAKEKEAVSYNLGYSIVKNTRLDCEEEIAG